MISAIRDLLDDAHYILQRSLVLRMPPGDCEDDLREGIEICYKQLSAYVNEARARLEIKEANLLAAAQDEVTT